MSKRTAARFLAASLLGLSLSGVAYGHGHSGHFGGAGGFHHFNGPGSFHHFHGGVHHFHRHHFGSRIIIGGSAFVPFDYPPPPVQYIEPNPTPSAPQPFWFYCPDSKAYYP